MTNTIDILLADDDTDDEMLFREALKDIDPTADLTTLTNGEQLMQQLNKKDKLPDILFLDLNMPRKNGLECLTEIKKDKNLKELPVIIFTTACEIEIINELYKIGAQYYIQKPNTYDDLKKVISQALILSSWGSTSQPSKEKFVLAPHTSYHLYS